MDAEEFSLAVAVTLVIVIVTMSIVDSSLYVNNPFGHETDFIVSMFTLK